MRVAALSGPLLVGVLRLAFMAVGIVAMAYQFGYLYGNPAFSAGNFFSFFTIESNILAVVMLGLLVVVRGEERTPVFEALRGAVVLYVAITGIVFALLLSRLQEELQTATAWVDFVVHKLLPIVLVADWVLDPPRRRLPLWVAAAWLSYPLAYVVYTLVRGPYVDWYPYPFLDVSLHGYGGVAWRCVVLSVGFAAGAVLVVVVGNRMAAFRVRRHRVPPSEATGASP